MHEWVRDLGAWHDFYVFAGTAAATVMGLMFVVMSLGQRSFATPEGTQAIRGFFTPIIMFFAAVIVVAMLMLIPHVSAIALAVLLIVLGITGIVYMISSGALGFWKDRELGVDDLAWYVVLPYLSFALIAVSGITIWTSAPLGEYVEATAMILLLVTGIRNAWDLTVYLLQLGAQ